MKPKKSLGQNFLIDEKYINIIIEEIKNVKKDLIIEIGPGKGALTKKLKTLNCDIIAFEIDKDLRQNLNLLEDNRTKIIYQDFLDSDLKEITKNYNSIILVGNLPYYITTPILEHIISSNVHFEKLYFMVQKEVANRFTAKDHTKEYGYFTLYLKYYFNINKLVDVPSEAFFPRPKVTSTIIKLIERKNKPEVDKNIYFQLIKDSFQFKRKTLQNNLKGYNWPKIKNVLETNGYNSSSRAEELTEDIFIEITKVIKKD